MISGLLFSNFSCQKKESFPIGDIKKTDEELVQIIINKSEFSVFANNLNKILDLSKVSVTSSEKNIISLQKDASNVNSRERAVLFLKSLGLLNAEQIILINEENVGLLNKIIANTHELTNLATDRIRTVFKLAIEKRNSNEKLERNLFRSLDVCSSAYASGINGCTRQLGVELLAVETATIAGVAAGSPIAGGIIFLGGVAGAYLHEYSCRQDVLGAWKACREEHPIN